MREYIESTLLDPSMVGDQVDQLVKEAIENKFHGVCVPPFWVNRASREIGDHSLKLATVIGYPLGYQRTEAKMKEIQMAVEDGADELDVVMNLSAYNAHMNWFKIELAKIAEYVHEKEKVVKVIIETDLWSDEQLLDIAKIVADSGADFVKTSTGYHRSPVNIKTVKLLRKNLPEHVGIKASGGISDKTQAQFLIDAGADRLGTSKAKELVDQ